MSDPPLHDLLKSALAAVDRAATTLPDTPDGRERLIVELGIARRSIKTALGRIAKPGQDSGVDLLSYLESTELIDMSEVRPQIWYIIAPLPIVRRLDVAGLVRDATPAILKLIIETINDGHIGDPWMHPGDYDWTEHSKYAEVSIMRGRQRRPQSLFVSVDGVVALRDSGAVRGHYPVSVYHAMLETTLHFVHRLYQSADLQMTEVAVQTNMVNAHELRMDIMRGVGSASYRFQQRGTALVPKEPVIVAPIALSSPGPVVSAVVQALMSMTTIEMSHNRNPDDKATHGP